MRSSLESSAAQRASARSLASFAFDCSLRSFAVYSDPDEYEDNQPWDGGHERIQQTDGLFNL